MKKYIICIVLTIISIPVCIYLSQQVYTFLEHSTMSYNFIEILKSIIQNVNHFKLFVFIQVIGITFIILLFLNKNNIFESNVQRITDTIRTPSIIGQNQFGSSRWLTQKEFEKKFTKNEIDIRVDIKNQISTKGGLVVGYKKIGKFKEEIYYIDGDTHAIIIGATRSGKSRTCVLQTIGNLSLAKHKESMIINDPKRRTLSVYIRIFKRYRF